MQLLVAIGLFLRILGLLLKVYSYGKDKDIPFGSVPKYVAMRSWRVFSDYPNVITLQILAVKVVDLTERVYGSNPLIFPLAVRTIGKPSPYSTDV